MAVSSRIFFACKRKCIYVYHHMRGWLFNVLLQILHPIWTKFLWYRQQSQNQNESSSKYDDTLTHTKMIVIFVSRAFECALYSVAVWTSTSLVTMWDTHYDTLLTSCVHGDLFFLSAIFSLLLVLYAHFLFNVAFWYVNDNIPM